MKPRPPNPYDLVEPAAPGVPQPAPARPAGSTRFDRNTEVLLEDRPCRSCGYNLRGLPIGGNCPECGAPITRFKAAPREDTILEAPPGYIRLVQLAFWLLAIGATVGLGALVGGAQGSPYAAVAGVVGACCWALGVGLICLNRPPAPPGRKRVSEWTALRIAAGVTQGFWLGPAFGLGLVVPAVPAVTGAPPPAMSLGAMLVVGAALIAVLGLLPTMWLIANICEWSSDPDRARRMKLVSSWAVIAGVLAALGVTFRVPVFLPVPSLLRSGLAGFDLVKIFLIWCVFYFFFSLWKIAEMMGYAAENAKLRRDRDERLREKVLAERAAAAEALRRNEPFGGPLP